MIDWSAQTLVHLVPPVIGMAASAGVGLWYRQRRVLGLLTLLSKVCAVALLLSRGVFILQHGDTYGGDFAAMLDFTDGGFQPMVALFVACVMGMELTRQNAAMRRPVVVAVLVGALAWAGGTIATGAFAPVRRGMPAVAVRDLEGKAVHMNSFTTKPMVVNLWATWCPPCRREMPVLRDAQRRHPDIVFVFLNQGESAASIRRYLAAQHIDIDNVLSDPLGTFAQQSGSYAYPTSLFFDGKGELIARHVGELTQDSLDERLRMLGPHAP